MPYTGQPVPTGVVQSTYPDQANSALAGQLANASDVNLVDQRPVLSAAGVTVGRACFSKTVLAVAEAQTTTVIMTYTTAPTANYTVGETITQTTSSATALFVRTDTENKKIYMTYVSGTFTGTALLTGGSSGVTCTPTTVTLVVQATTGKVPAALRSGVNNIGVISTPDAVSAGIQTLANFAGVVCRTLAGWAGSTINAIWPLNTYAPVARPERSGTRIWVETSIQDTIAPGDIVYVVTVLGSSPAADRAVGQFTNSAAPDSDGTAVALTGSYFKSAGNKTIHLAELTKVQAPSMLRTAVSKTADATLNLAELTNTIINAHHATVAIALTLPAAGSTYTGCDALIGMGDAAAVTVICAAGFGGGGGGKDTITLARGDMCHVYCDGTNWYVGNVTTSA